MAQTKTQPFRLLDLPGEVRTKIYQELLYSFQYPQGVSIPSNTAKYVYQPHHRIETAILRTSRQVHREAYDVMVKTNQFINIECRHFPLTQLLIAAQVPVVTRSCRWVNQFKGYLLKLFIHPKDGPWDISFGDNPIATQFLYGSGPTSSWEGEQLSLMVLKRDFDCFCGMFLDIRLFMPDFKDAQVKFTIWLNTFPPELPAWKAPITDFFTEKTQNALPKPLRSHVREITRIEIGGTVDRALAEAVQGEMMGSRLVDPQGFLHSLNERKAEGLRCYREKKYIEADYKWRCVGRDITLIQASNCWGKLIKHGDKELAAGVIEIQFTTLLNMSQVSLTYMKDAARLGYRAYRQEGHRVRDLHLQAHHFLEDYIRKGGTWRPTSIQEARFEYQKALSLRLLEDDEFIGEALWCIDRAMELSPNDQAIIQEKQNILNWRQEFPESSDDDSEEDESDDPFEVTMENLFEGFMAALRLGLDQST
ncbi:hypothetical protein BDV96DRAFT_644755 [Lophiotrema nucula]|uniref:Uncharacterized protein n=1 Tax=Lophiotrema nucula TaxID=690887 RepID=A0A6A5ZCU1_9PLEO|nr:hypothetical protein BDV96DRAFT_644755 [Lophiotrema nucula]